VIAVRADRPAQRRARATHDEAIGRFLGVGADRAEVVDHARNPVALLHAQLLRPSHDGVAFRSRGETGEHDELVDHGRHITALDRGPAKARRLRANRADRLATDFPLYVPRDGRPHLASDIEEPHASFVEADVSQLELAPISEQRDRNEKRRGRCVARHVDVERLQSVHGFEDHSATIGANARVHRREQSLGVVARRRRLVHFRPHARDEGAEEYRALGLRTRGRRPPNHWVEIRTVDDHRQPVTALEIDRRPHRFERLLDPFHRTARETLIADEPRRERMAGDDAGKQTRGRAAIPAIEMRARGAKPASSPASNARLPIGRFDRRA
jgi:hypothetical protein